MAKQNLFEGAVLVHPEDPEEDDTELAVEPTHVLATSKEAARTRITRQVPKKYEGREDNWEVLVRPI